MKMLNFYHPMSILMLLQDFFRTFNNIGFQNYSIWETSFQTCIFLYKKNIGQILSLKKSCLTLCSENTSTRLSRHRPYMNTSHDHTILYWILLQCIYWRLYWIIGWFYQKCVCMGFLYIYFVEIGSKTRTGFSLDFVLDNWWIFVT